MTSKFPKRVGMDFLLVFKSLISLSAAACLFLCFCDILKGFLIYSQFDSGLHSNLAFSHFSKACRATFSRLADSLYLSSPLPVIGHFSVSLIAGRPSILSILFCSSRYFLALPTDVAISFSISSDFSVGTNGLGKLPETSPVPLCASRKLRASGYVCLS